jgi:hypothetical protein
MDTIPTRWISNDGKIRNYVVNCSLFKMNDLFVSWRLNRPSDVNRVREIRNYLFEHMPQKIDGEILAAEVQTEWEKGNRKYEIYDGNHRREAIQTGFCDISPESKIILTIIRVKNDEELLEEFRRINKSIPLSDADLCGDIIVQKDVHIVAKEYCDKFPTLVRITPRPHRPNFNRDLFAQELYTIYKEFQDFQKVKDILSKYDKYLAETFSCLDDNTNSRLANKTIDGLTISRKMYNTAKNAGCFIFLSKTLAEDVILYAAKM